jgi:cellulose synthase/poly-beta-1,6-N-acetylglucosamine synthase-like glycosyltransferase
VVVPAHNEEASIAHCVAGLLHAKRDAVDLTVVVVADNCQDLTATAAAEAGARVLVRHNLVERGKGYALDYAFSTLSAENFDGFLVVDADSAVSPNLPLEVARALANGADAAQCRYLVGNPGASMRTRLMNVALLAFNVVRPRGRHRLGLSAGIYGNGFALSSETLRVVPYTAASVVEDLEYHLALARAGKRVEFADAATVYGEMPVAGKGVQTQRTRWEGGRFRMLVERAPTLAMELFKGRFRLLEPLLDLLLLPLAFHVSLLLLAVLPPAWPVRAAGLVGLGVVAFHLIAAIVVGGGGARDAMALLAAPFYMLWKLLLIPALLKSSRSETAWVRTERTLPVRK